MTNACIENRKFAIHITNRMNKGLLTIGLILTAIAADAQSTFNGVAVLFDTYCNQTCHGISGPGSSLNLQTADMNMLYADLVSATPANPAAAAKGYKLVDPGYPHNSFLLNKCASSEWDSAFNLDNDEGDPMPEGQPSMAKEEIELIRQWVIYGAPQSGQVVNPTVLDNFYNNNGMERMDVFPAPDPSVGFQIHFGPIFLEPGDEVEFYKKHKIYNQDLEQVVRMDVDFNQESHHYLLFEFTDGSEAGIEEGLRPVGFQNAFQDADYIVGWVDPDSTVLPAGTAYFFDEQTVLDQNYHLVNYAFNGDSILAAEAYINFITNNDEPLQRMHSDLLIYPVFQFAVPNDGNEHTFEESIFDGGSDDTWNVWLLSTHTHKYGTDYDLFMRNPDGSRGDQIFEGFFDTEYNFNQGYYDWEHPPKRYFDPALPIEEKYGVIQEAKYQINDPNETANTIFFGLTTDDEMMLTFIQYTRESENLGPDGIVDGALDQNGVAAFPNPFTDETSIVFNVEQSVDIRLEVFNTLGQSVEVLFDGENVPGRGMSRFKPSSNLDPNGVYLVRLTTPDKVYSTRLIKLNQ
jgi:hypothetical protein